jgi:non-heme chloroperoxidase
LDFKNTFEIGHPGKKCNSKRNASIDTPKIAPILYHQINHRQFNYKKMNKLTVKDGTEIYYKDLGQGQPIFFHHGWPLSSDDWDAQMMFFLEKGFRVIAHDRRGHGRSTQTYQGNDMDTYAADVAELTAHLDLKNAIHVGHSTGGGEAIRYAAKYGKGRVAKVVLISAITPYMIADERNPDGVPLAVFDDIRYNTQHNRAQFYQDITIPFLDITEKAPM